MPERKIDFIYNMKRMNVWFALWSLALVLTSIWIVWADYNRPWKGYQREFRKLDLEKTREALAEEEQKIQKEHGDQIAGIEKELARVAQEIEARRSELSAVNAAVAKADAAHYVADRRMKDGKAVLDALRYETELAKEEKKRSAPRKEAELGELQREYEEAKLAEEKAAAILAAARVKVAEITGKQEELSKKTEELHRERSRIQAKVKAIGPSFANDYFRNLPLLDFIAPSVKVNQIVVPALQDYVGFETSIPKVERCTTCHLAIEREGWDGEKQPFRSHPKVGVAKDAPEGSRPTYLAAKSPHPMDGFACTVCHGGQPRATDFRRANHAPNAIFDGRELLDEKQEKEWEEKYGWERDEFWDYPMRPMRYVESGCVKCHRSSLDVPEAAKVSYGKRLVAKVGCFGCHKIASQGFEDLRKVGPDLRRIKAKVTPEWAARWVRRPKAFRPTTKMPQIFDLSNTSGPEDKKKNGLAVQGVVTYLMAKSQDFALPETVPAGDAAHGKALYESVGCRGCHNMGAERNGAGKGFEDFGPNLAGVGSKLSPRFLYAWLKDPKAYFPETKMPNLRLSDQEAADIAAFLASSKLEDLPAKGGGTQGDRFAALDREPAGDDKLLEEMVLDYLHNTASLAEAKQRLAAMPAREDKLVFLGSKIIARQGCFGCHLIPGFEEAQPIGTELSDQGRKLVIRIDYGLEKTNEIPHTLHDFIFNKLREPRQFDKDRIIKRWDDRLRMPFFDFTHEEAEAITTYVLGLTKEEIPADRRKSLSTREADIEAGRRLVRKRNCTGCHVIEGQGGDIRAYSKPEEYGNAPPVLFREGAKVNSDWLFGFLRDVTPIRPWLKVRMPTFGFTDEEATILTRYFAAFDSEPYPFETFADHAPPEDKLKQAEQLFTQCMSCHVAGDVLPPGKDPAQLAPNLLMAKKRLRAKWIAEWLKDPQKLQPGTRMPNFFYDEGKPLYPDADDQIQAIRHYILNVNADTIMAQAKAAAAAAPPPAAGAAESYE